MALRTLSRWTTTVAAWSLGAVLSASERPGVECALPDGRWYRLAAAGGGSRHVLSYRAKPGARQIDLPVGTPTFHRAAGCETAARCPQGSFAFRSPNGGIILEIDALEARSTIDIFVSYELEVNVDVGLSPDIDELNTHGRQSAACRLLEGP